MPDPITIAAEVIPLIGSLFSHHKRSVPGPPPEQQQLLGQLNQLFTSLGVPALRGLYGQTSMGGYNPLTSPLYRMASQDIGGALDRSTAATMANTQRGLQQRGIYSPATYAGTQAALGASSAAAGAEAQRRLAEDTLATQQQRDLSVGGILAGLGSEAGGAAQRLYGNQLQQYGLQTEATNQADQQLGEMLGYLAAILASQKKKQQLSQPGGTDTSGLLSILPYLINAGNTGTLLSGPSIPGAALPY